MSAAQDVWKAAVMWGAAEEANDGGTPLDVLNLSVHPKRLEGLPAGEVERIRKEIELAAGSDSSALAQALAGQVEPDQRPLLSGERVKRICKHITKLGYRPTLDELVDNLQMGKSTVQAAMKELERKGYIETRGGEP